MDAPWSLEDIKEDKYIPDVALSDLDSGRDEEYYSGVHHEIEALKMRLDSRLETLLREEKAEYGDLSKQIESLNKYSSTSNINESTRRRVTNARGHPNGRMPSLFDAESDYSYNIASQISTDSSNPHHTLATTSSATTQPMANGARNKTSVHHRRPPTPDDAFSGNRVLGVLHESDDEESSSEDSDDLVLYGLGEARRNYRGPKNKRFPRPDASPTGPSRAAFNANNHSPKYHQEGNIIHIDEKEDREDIDIIHLESNDEEDASTELIDHIDFSKNTRHLPDPSPRESAPLLRDWKHSDQNTAIVLSDEIKKKNEYSFRVSDKEIRAFLRGSGSIESQGPSTWDTLVNATIQKLTGSIRSEGVPQPTNAPAQEPTKHEAVPVGAEESREDQSEGSEKRSPSVTKLPRTTLSKPDPEGTDIQELEKKLYPQGTECQEVEKISKSEPTKAPLVPQSTRVDSSESNDAPFDERQSEDTEANGIAIASSDSGSGSSITNYTESYYDSSQSGDPPTVYPKQAKRLNAVKNMAYKDGFGDSGRYSGELKYGRPDGRGTLRYSDGRSYQGEWRSGHWHGRGKASFSNGDVFHGTYLNDKRHGKGVYKYHDGRKYDGAYKQDRRDGMGTFTWPDGSRYIGCFKGGKREGKGHYKFPDGSTYTGYWKNGKYDGIGEVVWASGRRYRGEFKEGLAHGYGIEYRADGSVRHDGRWEKDRPVRKINQEKHAGRKTSYLRPLGHRFECN